MKAIQQFASVHFFKHCIQHITHTRTTWQLMKKKKLNKMHSFNSYGCHEVKLMRNVTAN